MLWVLDNTCAIVGTVENMMSIIWTQQFYGPGDFEIKMPCTPEAVQLLTVGRILCRDTDRAGDHFGNCMIIRKVAIRYEIGAGYIMTVTGRGLKDILRQRVIWQQWTQFDCKADVAITEMVLRNCGAVGPREFPGLHIPTPAGFAAEGQFQVFGQNLAEWIEAVAREFEIGWDIYIEDGGLWFDLSQGTNRTRGQSTVPPVVFSPGFDNLLECEYTLTREDYTNAALIGGEGEGTAKTVADIGTAEDFARYELYVDGSGVSSNGSIITAEEYEDLLKQYGQTALEEQQPAETFTATIDPAKPYKMGVDYFLGDILEVETGYNITATGRLVEIIESEDQTGKQATATFEKWEV